MRKPLYAALLLAGSTAILSACGDDAQTEQAAPEGIDGLTVTNARMVLNAVEGNPAAVYFDLAYNGDRPVSLARANVEGAESAAMHEYSEWEGATRMMEKGQMTLEPGKSYQFEPGGDHVMAMSPSPDLEAGGTTEVTLTIAGGDKLSFPVDIFGAGDER